MRVPSSFRRVRSMGLRALFPNKLAPYRSGRSKTWLKCKCFTESTFVVVGTDRDRKTGALRALLAHPNSEAMNYAGAAFIALGDDARTEKRTPLMTQKRTIVRSRLHLPHRKFLPRPPKLPS